jgi:hypothetical protein
VKNWVQVQAFAFKYYVCRYSVAKVTGTGRGGGRGGRGGGDGRPRHAPDAAGRRGHGASQYNAPAGSERRGGGGTAATTRAAAANPVAFSRAGVWVDDGGGDDTMGTQSEDYERSHSEGEDEDEGCEEAQDGVDDDADERKLRDDGEERLLAALAGSFSLLGAADELETAAAVGLGSTAVGLGSTAVGLGSTAVGLGSTAVGSGVSAVRLGSTAIGVGSTAAAGERQQQQRLRRRQQQTRQPSSSSSSAAAAIGLGSSAAAGARQQRRLQTRQPSSSSSSPAADFGKFEAHTKGFGSKMMAQMGFVPGRGLGPELEGIHEPLSAQQRPKNLGLGAEGAELR